MAEIHSLPCHVQQKSVFSVLVWGECIGHGLNCCFPNPTSHMHLGWPMGLSARAPLTNLFFFW